MVATANRRFQVQRLNIVGRTASTLLLGLEHVGVVWWGAILALRGELSIGMLFAFVSFKEQFTSRLTALSDRIVDFAMLRLHAERLADIVLTPKEVSGQAQARIPEAATSIRVENVSFRYSDMEEYVIEDCSLSIAAGECVAIVGPSGCGKTTLLKLMLGLLKPCRGKILIDGVDLSQIDIRAYREAIGIVMQEDQMFAGSIASNISFFDADGDQRRIEHAAKMAAIHDDIMKMPMRYQTLIGDMGAALSGGQKQRLLLARALYRQPSMLFLDEATSHLDMGNEKLVNRAIRSMALTRIIIAHRPETIAAADRVIRLEGGKVVDHVAHREMIEQLGR